MQNATVQNIILTGFMGTGKSSVGQALAKRLGRPFVDMDALIEEREGRSVRQIFEDEGEAYFRQLESDLCREIANLRGYVIAAGGGTLVNPKNLAALAKHHIVCLDCEPETLWQRLSAADDRPMLDGANKKTRLLNLLQARQPAYARIPHHVDVTNFSIDEAADDIISIVKRKESKMMEADALFEDALAWLKKRYTEFRFFLERDLVWTVQMRLIETIVEYGLPYRIYNDYPMLSGKRRSLSTDIAILDAKGAVKVAVEFKYEPSHSRNDILKSKFPVVFWGQDGIAKDLYRIERFVSEGRAQAAYSIFIDEGGYFRKRPPHSGSRWIDWENGVSVLYAKRQDGQAARSTQPNRQ